MEYFNDNGYKIMKRVLVGGISPWGKKIETLKDLRDFLNNNLDKMPDDTKIYFEKINLQKRTIECEPLVVEIDIPMNENSPINISFRNGNINRFE